MSDTETSRNLMARFLAAMPADERAEFLSGISMQPGETDGTGTSPSTLDTAGDATGVSGGDGFVPSQAAMGTLSQQRPMRENPSPPTAPVDVTGGGRTTPSAPGAEHTTNRHITWALPGQAMGTATTCGTTTPSLGVPLSLLSFATEQSKNWSPERKMQEATACLELVTNGRDNWEHITTFLARPVLTEQGLKPRNMVMIGIEHLHKTFSVFHSASQCILPVEEAEGNKADGQWFAFIGDRVQTTLPAGSMIFQDPPMVRINWEELFQQEVIVKAVTKKEMDKRPEEKRTDFITPHGGSNLATTRVMIIPWMWVPFLLTEDRSPADLWTFINAETQHWTEEPHKATKTAYLDWVRAAAAARPAQREGKQVWVNASALIGNWHSVQLPNRALTTWATLRLNEFLPYPVAPAPKPAAPLPNSGSVLGDADMQHAIASTLARVLENQAERDIIEARRQQDLLQGAKKKSLEEPVLCNLLGWCGLTWDERHHLPPIWTTLVQCTNKPQKYMALRAEFQKLAQTVGAFRHFENRQLCDNIIEYALAPGLTDRDMHLGVSPLAFVMKTAAEAQQLAFDYDILDAATTITTADITKLARKGPPPLPLGFFDFMQILDMQEAFLKAFFTVRCDAWLKFRNFKAALITKGPHVMGNTTLLGSIIPNTTWALIKDHNQFFTTVTERDQLDSEQPILPTSDLEFVAMQICNLQLVKMLDMPPLLAEPFRTKVTTGSGPTKASGKAGGKRHSDTDLEEPPITKLGRQGNSDAKGGFEPVTNPDQPPVFANDALLTQLLQKFPRVTLNQVSKAAGYDKFADVPRGTLTTDACGPWIFKGKCVRNCVVSKRKGKNCHLTAAECSADGCKILLDNLRPGIQKLLSESN